MKAHSSGPWHSAASRMNLMDVLRVMKEMRAVKANKYSAGDEVYAKKDPEIKLIVRRYVDSIYYCRFPNEPDRKELALFERELF